jgi:hypothetical protein
LSPVSNSLSIRTLDILNRRQGQIFCSRLRSSLSFSFHQSWKLWFHITD